MAWQTGRLAGQQREQEEAAAAAREREDKGIDSEVGRQEGAGLVRVAGGGSGV